MQLTRFPKVPLSAPSDTYCHAIAGSFCRHLSHIVQNAAQAAENLPVPVAGNYLPVGLRPL